MCPVLNRNSKSRVPFRSSTDFNDARARWRLTSAAPSTGGRKTELLAVILTCDSYSTVFDKPPETPNDNLHVPLENKHPIEITLRKGLKRVSNKPGEFTHGIHCDFPVA
jgi:hypothetical protein